MKPEAALQLIVEGLKRAPFSTLEIAGLQVALDAIKAALPKEEEAKKQE